jgi:N-acetylglucosaminyldiphosphoundecaprenol N-acetyl-beta-D-mannosaminyltransferase
VIDAGKHSILGIMINAIDYETAADRIIGAAKEGRSLTVSALAVHGVMTGVLDPEQKYRLNGFDLLVPDGQPVRWALNLLHRTGLRDRVYGPSLMHKVCARASDEGLSIYFYGSTLEVLQAMKKNLGEKFPGLRIAGMEPSKFGNLTPEEKISVANRIRNSGASIAMIGLGCPRQEVWAFEFRDLLPVPSMAVGAAFPFTAGKVRQAPKKLQDLGLEWAFRLYMEPRLWRRYLFLNPIYLLLLAFQSVGLCEFATDGRKPIREQLYG